MGEYLTGLEGLPVLDAEKVDHFCSAIQRAAIDYHDACFTPSRGLDPLQANQALHDAVRAWRRYLNGERAARERGGADG